MSPEEEHRRFLSLKREYEIQLGLIARRTKRTMRSFQILQHVLAFINYCEDRDRLEILTPPSSGSSSPRSEILSPPSSGSSSPRSEILTPPSSGSSSPRSEILTPPSSGSSSPPIEEIDEELKHKFSGEEYFKQFADNIVLGPNGTTIDMISYNSISWSSGTAVARQLLSLLFSDDILATHTLSGRPSPAFLDRDKPPKLPLDRKKVADIIHCVRSNFSCSEREIKVAITTKCTDIAKKHRKCNQRK